MRWGAPVRCRSWSLSLLVGATRTARDVDLHAIAEATAQIIAQAKVRRIFVTGGESAFAICRMQEIPALDLLAEIEPGGGSPMESVAMGTDCWR